MRKFILSIVFCVSLLNSLLAQENEVLIILYEDYNNSLTKREGQRTSDNKANYFYHFYFNKVDNVRLWFKQFENFEEMEKDNPVLSLEINKSFLRKNKDLIITKKKMLDLGYDKSCELLENAKTILLIDKNEINDGKILIKEVSYFPEIKM